MTYKIDRKRKKNLKTLQFSFLLSFFVLFTLSSCTSRKKILYLQDIKQDTTQTYNNANIGEYKICTGDILYINIKSMNKELISIFGKNDENNPYNIWNFESNIYVYGYSVDNNGDIDIPNLNKINVLNLSINEAQEKIQKNIRTVVNDASISVKLLSFKYTLIGEVNRPGTYTHYGNKINIFQALGYAGDITIFGDKTKVRLIREHEGGKNVYFIDITKSSILTSEFYYLHPNDILYIEPVSNKSFRQNLPNISIIFSSISTLILVLNFINKQ